MSRPSGEATRPDGAADAGGARLYTEGGYARVNPDWHEGDAPHKIAEAAALVLGAGLRPARVVDVGCGTGAVLDGLLRVLAADGVSAVGEGWDVAPEAISRARARERAGLAFREGDWLAEAGPDATSAGAGGGRADLILCLDVIEHVDDPLALLRAARERGDGLLLRVPLEGSRWDRARGTARVARAQYGHLHAWDRPGLIRLLQDAGWTPMMERYVRVPPQIARPAGRAMDAVRRAAVTLSPHAGVRWFGGYSWLGLLRPARVS